MKKIIIVDDDPAIRDAFGHIFKRAGFSVTLLADGVPLIAGLFEEPDIFLIDKQLRGIDGLDICRHLKNREENNRTPVIVFSASPRAETLAKEAGADVFLEKPINTKALLESVDRQIGHRVTFEQQLKKYNYPKWKP